MYNNVQNAFYRNGVYIPEFNRYKNGEALSRRNLEILKRKIRNNPLSYSKAFKNLLRNIESNILKKIGTKVNKTRNYVTRNNKLYKRRKLKTIKR